MRMPFKGFEFVLFLVLAVVLLPGAFAPSYQDFLKQHYDNPKSNVRNRYCDTMMERRGMTRRDTERGKVEHCKEKNSFVHGTKTNINGVCGSGGQPYGNGLQRSRRQFSVTTCTHRGGSNRPPCRYSENTSQRFIVVRCEGGNPVHFDEGQI